MKSRRGGVPPGVHLRGRLAPSAGVRGRRLKIAPRGRAAEGLAIDIAPCGRAAGRPPSWTLLPSAKGLAIDIAPRGRAAEGLAIENRVARACR